jgi:chemotaxis signal transduction protein
MNTQVFNRTALPSDRDPAWATGSTRTDSYLVFEVDGQPYALPIDRIERLMRLDDVSLRPRAAAAPGWELGRLATQEEGEGLPVASLRSLWGLPALSQGTQQKWQAILVVNGAGRQHALLVDECRCVLSQLARGGRGFEFPAALRGERGQAFHQATVWAQSLLIVLDLEALLRPVAEAYPLSGSALVATA